MQKSGEKKITNKKKNARRTAVDTKRHKEMRDGGVRPEREREREKKNIPNASKERERKTQRAVEKEMY